MKVINGLRSRSVLYCYHVIVTPTFQTIVLILQKLSRVNVLKSLRRYVDAMELLTITTAWPE